MGYYGRGCKRSKYVINHVDIAPTTLGLCGIDAPDYMCGYDYSFERLPQERSPRGTPPESAYIHMPQYAKKRHALNQMCF